MNFQNLDSKTAAQITKYDIHPQCDEHRECDDYDEIRRIRIAEAEAADYEELQAASEIFDKNVLCCWCDEPATQLIGDLMWADPACDIHGKEYGDTYEND